MDVLDLANSAFRRVYGEGYLRLVEQAPHVLGYIYDRLNRRDPVGDRLRLALQRLNLRALARLLVEEPWDAVIHTHFLPAEIAAFLKRGGRLAPPQIVAVTDFEAHRIWHQPPCELYLVASKEASAFLQSLGAPPSSIRVTGIPIHPAFSRLPKRRDALRAASLSGERPVVLQLAGGSGVGPMEEAFRRLLEVETPLELVAVAGRNAGARERLRSLPVPARHRARVLGYTDRMHELMAAADLVVTKPGGLTVSEALAAGTPLLVIHPIPGQESRNSDFILENGAGLRVNSLATLPLKVSEILQNPSRLASLTRAARRLGRPCSASEAARAALELAAAAAARS